MAQIFLFGSSNTYGVGGTVGGWGDRLKHRVHHIMYGEGGIGEKHEIYNFGKPGATIQFVLQTFPDQLKHYHTSHKAIGIISVGGNNVKAEDRPDNYISSIEEYGTLMRTLLAAMKEKLSHILVLGYRPYDETKTLPKPNPLTGGCSYFWNSRTKAFEDELKVICVELGLMFIDVSSDIDVWIKQYQYTDGLHPNDAGYQLICDALVAELKVLDVI